MFKFYNFCFSCSEVVVYSGVSSVINVDNIILCLFLLRKLLSNDLVVLYDDDIYDPDVPDNFC